MNYTNSQRTQLSFMASGDMVIRPFGSPRQLYGQQNYNPLLCNTGLLEFDVGGFPHISVDPTAGGHLSGGGYRDTWIEARDVFLTFANKLGNPGWDINNDGDIDEEDMVPVIVFKQVEP